MTQFKIGQKVFAEVTVVYPVPDIDGEIECKDINMTSRWIEPSELHPSLPQIESELTDDERFRAQLAAAIFSGTFNEFADNTSIYDAVVYANEIIAAVKATRKEGA